MIDWSRSLTNALLYFSMQGEGGTWWQRGAARGLEERQSPVQERLHQDGLEEDWNGGLVGECKSRELGILSDNLM